MYRKPHRITETTNHRKDKLSRLKRLRNSLGRPERLRKGLGNAETVCAQGSLEYWALGYQYRGGEGQGAP